MRLAVFLPSWVGDAVMATPALRALREHFAGRRLVGVLKPYVAGVLEGAPWLDELVFLDSRGAWSRRWPAPSGRCGASPSTWPCCSRTRGARRWSRAWAAAGGESASSATAAARCSPTAWRRCATETAG